MLTFISSSCLQDIGGNGRLDKLRRIKTLWERFLRNRILDNWITMSAKDEDKRLASYVSFITFFRYAERFFFKISRSSRKNNLFQFMI